MEKERKAYVERLQEKSRMRKNHMERKPGILFLQGLLEGLGKLPEKGKATVNSRELKYGQITDLWVDVKPAEAPLLAVM